MFFNFVEDNAMKNDIVVRFVGSAGDGLVSIGELFGKILKKHNFNVLGFRSYQSVIRGGYNTYQIRASQEKVLTVGEEADIIVLLNKHVAEIHREVVHSGARIIYDNEDFSLDELEYPPDTVKLPIPLKAITKEITTLKVVRNVVGFGAIAYLLGLNMELIEEVLKEQFQRKGEKVVEINVLALKKGYEYAEKENWSPIWEKQDYKKSTQMLLSGNDAIALGLLAGGLKFYSGYPITPASSIIHYLTKHLPKLGIIVKQTEDEIAAVGMAIGAAYCGVRAATGTSGAGFSLMSEMIGMAAMEEIPLVVINSQRVGPSTGMATKTEQGDLFQALGVSQGEFPKIIIAPSDVEDAFQSGIEALELAEKYQTVVIVLMDLYLSEQIASVKRLPFKRKNKRYGILSEVKGEYRRFVITPNGVSPRTLPGTKNGMYHTTSSEHQEDGSSIASTLAGLPHTLEIRKAMVQKRMRKLEYVLKELPPPKLEGKKDADITLISWGSTKNIVAEAVIKLNEIGLRANHLHIKYVSPLHINVINDLLKNSKILIAVELNYEGQMRKYLRMEAGLNIPYLINRYNGEPITSSEIVMKVKEIVQNE